MDIDSLKVEIITISSMIFDSHIMPVLCSYNYVTNSMFYVMIKTLCTIDSYIYGTGSLVNFMNQKPYALFFIRLLNLDLCHYLELWFIRIGNNLTQRKQYKRKYIPVRLHFVPTKPFKKLRLSKSHKRRELYHFKNKIDTSP